MTAAGGGGTASATSDGAFADTPILAGDIDGNGVPEIITLEHWAPSYLPGGATTTVIALLRYELAGDELVQVQRFEVTVPIAEPFVRFIALGDVDGDGFADFVLVSPETYPGGGIACVPGGARIRVLSSPRATASGRRSSAVFE